MPTCVADCPRCGANNITFDSHAHTYIGADFRSLKLYEIFAECRACHRPTLLKLEQSNSSVEIEALLHDSVNPKIMLEDISLNDIFEVRGYVSLKDESGIDCPEHTPDNLENIFNEGTACFAIGCYNASVSMFRLCLDIDTKQIAQDNGIKGNLNARLNQLFTQHLLPQDLEELSHCIRENGNDGAHDGTITKVEALDVMDFTVSYLEARYTMPERIRIRREERRNRHTSE